MISIEDHNTGMINIEETIEMIISIVDEAKANIMINQEIIIINKDNLIEINIVNKIHKVIIIMIREKDKMMFVEDL